MIAADLHMSAKDDLSDSIVSLMRMNRELYDRFAEEIIQSKPDLFIALGDNTQSGSAEDMRMLRSFLKRLDDQGIAVIMAAGNHDFDQGSEQAYRSMFFDLLKPDECDEASLSFSRTFRQYRFISMDDHEGKYRPGGLLKKETIDWLEQQLVSAAERNEKVIFLCHHPLHPESWMGRPEFYLLQPEGIREMLAAHGVKLVFSGHLHDPRIIHSSLYEITLPILAGGAHMYGTLRLEDNTAVYRLRQLVFDDPLTAAKAAKKDRAVLEKRRDAWLKTLSEKCDENTAEKCADALIRWQIAYNKGALFRRRDEFFNDPDFTKAMELLKDDIFGRWIRSQYDSGHCPCDALTIRL